MAKEWNKLTEYLTNPVNSVLDGYNHIEKVDMGVGKLIGDIRKASLKILTEEQYKESVSKISEEHKELLKKLKVKLPEAPLIMLEDLRQKAEEEKKRAEEEKNYNIDRAISAFTDYLDMAKQFIKIQPIYYDINKIWWLWNFKDNCWEMKDEIDLMNLVDDSVNAKTTSNSTKSEIIESIKRIARKNKPKELPKTWIQFRNKIVDVVTGEEIEVSPKYFATNPISWNVGKSADTPVMDKLFADWVGEEYVETLYEIVAFSLSQEYFLDRIFCLVGAGLNGKTTLLKLIKKFIGGRNITSTELDDLIRARFEKAKLYKKLVCIMGETNFSTLSKTSLLKKLSGRDLIGFEIKHKNPFDDENSAKIMIATNSLPKTLDKTKGFYRRWIIIKFPNEFSEKKDILETIPDEEYENLAKKSIGILKRLRETREFTKEGSVKYREQIYEEVSDPLRMFISEDYVEDVNGSIVFWDFFEKFQTFLLERKYRSQNKKEVGQALKDMGFIRKTEHYKKEDGSDSTQYVYFGLRDRDVRDVSKSSLSFPCRDKSIGITNNTNISIEDIKVGNQLDDPFKTTGKPKPIKYS